MKNKTLNICTLALFSSFALTSCGFQPMYGKHVQTASRQDTNIQNQLAEIDIANIPDAEGVYLRNALMDRFYRTQRPQNPRYTLTVGKIRESIVDLDITKTSDATRAQLRLNTEMTLTDNQSGEAVLTRSLGTVTSYNILTSEFATRVSEDNTRKNALDDLARQIELQTGLYLRR